MKKLFIVSAVSAALLALAFGASAQTVSVSQLQAEIAQLEAQLQSMLTQQSQTTTTTQTQTSGTTTSTCVPLTDYLLSGSSDATNGDDQVAELQSLLNVSGDTSGVFGNNTQAAVTQFQASNNISPTGTTGPKTRKALNAAYGCSNQSNGGASSVTIISPPAEVTWNLNDQQTIQWDNPASIQGQTNANLTVTLEGPTFYVDDVYQESNISLGSTGSLSWQTLLQSNPAGNINLQPGPYKVAVQIKTSSNTYAASSNIFITDSTAITCTPNWQCVSSCVNGIQTQQAVDENNCGVTNNQIACSNVATSCNSSSAILSTPTIVASSTTPSQYISATGGAINAAQATYNFVSTGGTSTITDLKFNISGSDATPSNTVTNICVGNICAQPVNGTADLTGLNLAVPNGGGLNENVLISYSNVGTNGIPSGTTVSINLVSTGYTSGSSPQTLTSSVSSPIMTLVGSTPAVTVNNGSGIGMILNSLTQVGQVTVTANPKGAIRVRQITFNLSYEGFTTSPTSITSAFIALDGQNVPIVGSLCNNLSAPMVSCVMNNTNSYASDFPIAAGQSQTFDLFITTTGATASANTIPQIVATLPPTGFLWDDTSTNGASGVGLTGSLILGFPTNSYVSTSGNTTTPSITVTSPNGGETWTQGQTYNIAWTASGSSNFTDAPVNIQLENTATNVYVSIAAAQSSSGTYSWTIPTTLNGISTIGNQFKVVISAHDFDISGVSANTFTIAAPTTTCTPNWQCSGFTNSSCVNGVQTQTCTDTNNCGVTTAEPSLTQTCTAQPVSADVCPAGSAQVTIDPTSSSGTTYHFTGTTGQYRIEMYSPVGLADSGYTNYTWANNPNINNARILGGNVNVLVNKTPTFGSNGHVNNYAAYINGAHVDTFPPAQYNNSRQTAANKSRGMFTTLNLTSGDTLDFVVDQNNGSFSNNSGSLTVSICPATTTVAVNQSSLNISSGSLASISSAVAAIATEIQQIFGN